MYFEICDDGWDDDMVGMMKDCLKLTVDLLSNFNCKSEGDISLDEDSLRIYRSILQL